MCNRILMIAEGFQYLVCACWIVADNNHIATSLKRCVRPIGVTSSSFSGGHAQIITEDRAGKMQLLRNIVLSQ